MGRQLARLQSRNVSEEIHVDPGFACKPSENLVYSDPAGYARVLAKRQARLDRLNALVVQEYGEDSPLFKNAWEDLNDRNRDIDP